MTHAELWLWTTFGYERGDNLVTAALLKDRDAWCELARRFGTDGARHTIKWVQLRREIDEYISSAWRRIEECYS